MSEDLIGVTEAAAILGCSVWTVHRRIRSGELDGRKIVGGWVVARRDVEELGERGVA